MIERDVEIEFRANLIINSYDMKFRWCSRSEQSTMANFQHMVG